LTFQCNFFFSGTSRVGSESRVACGVVINKYRQIDQGVGSHKPMDQFFGSSKPNSSFRINGSAKKDSKFSASILKVSFEPRGKTNSTIKLKGKKNLSMTPKNMPIRKHTRQETMKIQFEGKSKSARMFATGFAPSNDPLIQQNTLSHPVPGFSSITVCTKPGECFQETKTNQDSYLINTELDGDPNKLIFGVFDGHGSYGDKVSQYLKENFVCKNCLCLKF
jgi:hypothetical protein